MKRLLLLAALLAQPRPGHWAPTPLQTTQVEGVLSEDNGGTGAGSLICAAGDFITSDGSAYTCHTPAIAVPGGVVGNIQINNGVGGLGAYAGSSCGANQYASSEDASGTLTCAQVTTAQLSGTITNAQLASSYSGVGACSAHSWVSTLNANSAGTCTGATLASADFANQGSTTTLLHGNAAGNPSFAQASLTADVTGTLPEANGGTNAGALTCTNQFTTSNGTSYSCVTDTLASAQHANQGTTTTLLHGNGAGNPAWSGIALADFVANLGTTTQVLHGNAAGQPTYGAVVNADISAVDASKITTGTITEAVGGTGAGALTCTNQFLTSNGTAYSCSTATLAGAQFANQGTTTTVLHGNGAGNPSFAQVSLTADVTGTLAEGHGGTNQSTYTTGDILYASAANTLSKLADVAAGSLLKSGGVGVAPAYYSTPYLAAQMGAAQSITNNTVTTVIFGTVEQDTDSAYNAATGVYTVATGKDGVYEVACAIGWNTSFTGRQALLINRAGSTVRSTSKYNSGGQFDGLVLSAEVKVVAGNTLACQAFQVSGGSVVLVNADGTFLNIKQIL